MNWTEGPECRELNRTELAYFIDQNPDGRSRSMPGTEQRETLPLHSLVAITSITNADSDVSHLSSNCLPDCLVPRPTADLHASITRNLGRSAVSDLQRKGQFLLLQTVCDEPVEAMAASAPAVVASHAQYVELAE